MNIHESPYNLDKYINDLKLIQFLALDKFEQISSTDILHHHVNVLLFIIDFMQFYDILMVYITTDFYFSFNLHKVICIEVVFEIYFDSIFSMVFSFPGFTDHRYHSSKILRYRYLPSSSSNTYISLNASS